MSFARKQRLMRELWDAIECIVVDQVVAARLIAESQDLDLNEVPDDADGFFHFVVNETSLKDYNDVIRADIYNRLD